MEEGLLERERRQMDEIRQLDMEELQIEEVDSDQLSSADDDDVPRLGFSFLFLSFPIFLMELMKATTDIHDQKGKAYCPIKILFLLVH